MRRSSIPHEARRVNGYKYGENLSKPIFTNDLGLSGTLLGSFVKLPMTFPVPLN
jgi:hypothetical protein